MSLPGVQGATPRIRRLYFWRSGLYLVSKNDPPVVYRVILSSPASACILLICLQLHGSSLKVRGLPPHSLTLHTVVVEARSLIFSAPLYIVQQRISPQEITSGCKINYNY